MVRCIRCNQSYSTDQVEGSVCPYCGRVEGLFVSGIYLPENYILAKRYRVIRVMYSDDKYNVYQGWDIDNSILVQIREFYPKKVIGVGSNYVVKDRIDRFALGDIISTDIFENEKRSYIRRLDKHKIIREKYKSFQFTEHDSNICYYDVFEENNTIYEVRRYIKGRSLESIVESRRSGLEYNEICRILYKAFVLIICKFPRDIIYMGLTPKDIMIEQDSENVFIISRNTEIIKSEALNYDYINYMGEYDPPEMRYGIGSYGEYSEIYRFAAIMNYVLTGKKPFNKNGAVSLTFPSDIGKTLPDGVEKALRDALVKDYKKRTQDIRVFVSAALPERLVEGSRISWNIKIDIYDYSEQRLTEFSSIIQEYFNKHREAPWVMLLNNPYYSMSIFNQKCISYSCSIDEKYGDQVKSFFEYVGIRMRDVDAVAEGHLSGSQYAWDIYHIHDTGGAGSMWLRDGKVYEDWIYYS